MFEAYPPFDGVTSFKYLEGVGVQPGMACLISSGWGWGTTRGRERRRSRAGFVLGVLLCSGGQLLAATGVVQTTEGARWSGEISFGTNEVCVTKPGQPLRRVPLERLAGLKCNLGEGNPGSNRRNATGTFGGMEVPLRSGIILRDGSLLARQVKTLDETGVTFENGNKEAALPLLEVAQVHFQDLIPEKAKRLQTGRHGLLLTGGDFVDGEVQSIRQNRVRLSSVLFGVREYDIGGKVSAAILGDPTRRPAVYQLETRGGHRLRVTALTWDKSNLIVQDPPLRGLKIWTGEIVSLQRLAEKTAR